MFGWLNLFFTPFCVIFAVVCGHLVYLSPGRYNDAQNRFLLEIRKSPFFVLHVINSASLTV